MPLCASPPTCPNGTSAASTRCRRVTCRSSIVIVVPPIGSASLFSSGCSASLAAPVGRLRALQIIAPGITTLERLVWTMQRLAQRRVERLVLQPLTPEQPAHLDGLLQVDPELRTRTRLSWLREAPELPSAKSLRKVLDRLAYLRALDLPTPPSGSSGRSTWTHAI